MPRNWITALSAAAAGVMPVSVGSGGPATSQRSSAVSSSAPTANEILTTLAKTYEHCYTYRDDGDVVTTFLTGESTFTTHRPFRTHFDRPGSLRFEFDSFKPAGETDTYVVWAAAGRARSWWSIDPVIDDFDSIESALAGPTGISGASATRVPTLLMPNLRWGAWLHALQDPQIDGSDMIGGEECHRIKAHSPEGDKILWIGKRTSLLRRVKEIDRWKFTERTITITPQMNEPINPTVFQFTPPLVAEKQGGTASQRSNGPRSRIDSDELRIMREIEGAGRSSSAPRSRSAASRGTH